MVQPSISAKCVRIAIDNELSFKHTIFLINRVARSAEVIAKVKFVSPFKYFNYSTLCSFSFTTTLRISI